MQGSLRGSKLLTQKSDPRRGASSPGVCAYLPLRLVSGSSHLHRKYPATCATTETIKFARYSKLLTSFLLRRMEKGQQREYNTEVSVKQLLKQNEPAPGKFPWCRLVFCIIVANYLLFLLLVLVTAVVGLTAGERFGLRVTALVSGSPRARTSDSCFWASALFSSVTASVSA